MNGSLHNGFFKSKPITSSVRRKRTMPSGGSLSNMLWERGAVLSSDFSTVDLSNSISWERRLIFEGTGDVLPKIGSFDMCKRKAGSINGKAHLREAGMELDRSESYGSEGVERESTDSISLMGRDFDPCCPSTTKFCMDEFRIISMLFTMRW